MDMLNTITSPKNIIAHATIELVTTRIPHQDVVAITAIKYVIVIAPVHGVVPGATIQSIVTLATY